MKFSIRKLLLAVTVIGMLLAISVPIATHVSSQFDDKLGRSTNFITSNGGVVETDGDLKSVILASTGIKNSDLLHAKRINPYSLIDLSNTRIDDSGLHHLHDVRALRIDLTGTDVTATGVDVLRQNLAPTSVVTW